MASRFTDVVWPGWEVVRKLGVGSFGGVYEIQRTLPDGQVEKGALKKLTLPRNPDEIEELRSNQFDEASITAHFTNQLKNLVGEYGMMKRLSGCPNIVHSLDLRYVQHEDGIGWDLYIRMELLTPLKKVLPTEYSEQTVIAIGKDLCAALTACEKEHIIHRDIKPENILVSEDGVFKLGDFGVAKVAMENGTGTVTGTTGYMAPEISKHESYGPTVDIYSLGMVLYWMMNERTLPFLPMPPQIPTAMQHQEASSRRFRGEALPAPKNGSEALKQVVLKACAYHPEDRYQTADEMLSDLTGCTSSTVSEKADTETARPDEKISEKKHGRKKLPLKPIFAAAAVLCIASAVLLFIQRKKPVPAPEATVQSLAAEAAEETIVPEATVTAVDETVDDPVLELKLFPDDSASFSDVRHDTPLIKERIYALSAAAKISMNEETGEIDAAIPMSDIGYENDIESVLRATINRKQELYLIRYVSRYEYMYDDKDGAISREDITDVYQTTVGEMNQKLGMPLEVENYRGEPLILEGSQSCICLTLTQDRVDKLYNEFDRDGTDTFGFDVSMNYSVFFPYTYRASDGLTFVMVASGWKEENLTRAITYGLSHDVLNNGYSFQYAVVPEAYWETRESGTYFGQKQCEFQELKDPDNTVSIRLQISNYSDVSDSLIEEAIRQMKDRMDIIGTPYAFGMDIQSEDTAVIRTNPERLSADMLQFFSDSPSLQLAYSSEIPTWDMNVKSVEIVPIGGSGNIGLQVQYTDAAAVEELTSKLRWRDDKTLSYGWYDDPLVSAQITSTITEDTLLFTQFPMLGADSIDEQYRYILELIAYNLQAERTRAYTYSADYKFNSDSAHFGLSRLTAEDEEIIRYIQENYPEFEVWTDDERSKYLYVSMKAEIGPKFYYACFDQIEQIFKDCKLDDSDLDGAVFYLIEETGDQRCRLVFTRFSQDTYMSCTGNCKGYLLDGYTDEFSKTASWRPFFQKRSFEMYTA